eukprot:6358778-Pyramimonas_sp.AAC.1
MCVCLCACVRALLAKAAREAGTPILRPRLLLAGVGAGVRRPPSQECPSSPGMSSGPWSPSARWASSPRGPSRAPSWAAPRRCWT